MALQGVRNCAVSPDTSGFRRISVSGGFPRFLPVVIRRLFADFRLSSPFVGVLSAFVGICRSFSGGLRHAV